MPRAVSSGPPSRGQGSPARTSAASIVPSAVKSRPATRSSTWRPSSSAPVTQVVPSTTRGSTRNRMPDGVPRPERAGPDVPLASAGLAAKSASVNAVSSAGSTWAWSRFSSTSRSPGTPIASGSRVPSGCSSTTTTFLSVSAACHGRSLRGKAALRWSTSVSIVGVSGVSSTCAAGRPSNGDRRRASGPGRPRRWPRSRTSCSGRRCPRRSRRWRGTPHWPTRPWRRTWPRR